MQTIKAKTLPPKKRLDMWIQYHLDLGLTKEHRFTVRQWKFDYAWPLKKIAVEYEGGTFSRGGHTRGAGYSKNCEKYNEAACLGWKVFRFTTDMVDRQWDEITSLLTEQIL